MIARPHSMIALVVLGSLAAPALASAGPADFYRAQNIKIRMNRISSMSSAPVRRDLVLGEKKKGYSIFPRSVNQPSDSNPNGTMQQRKIMAMTRHLNAAADHIGALAENPSFAGSARQQELAASVRAMKVSSTVDVPSRGFDLLDRVLIKLQGRLSSPATMAREDSTAARYREAYERMRVAAQKLDVELSR